MTYKDATEALSTVISLALLILISRLYRDLAVDWFRENMHALRDELFDLVLHGELSIKDPAYVVVREVLDRLIGIAGHLDVFAIALQANIWRKADASIRPENHLESDIANAPPEVQRMLADITRRMHGHLRSFLATGNPLAFILTALVFPGVAAGLLRHHMSADVLDLVDGAAPRNGLPLFGVCWARRRPLTQ